MATESEARPISVTALSIFFWAGAFISFIAAASLLTPGSFLEALWRLNPRAREGLAEIGAWAILLMGAVSVACAMAAAGLWRGSRGGYWLALTLLAINLIGDIADVLLGTESRGGGWHSHCDSHHSHSVTFRSSRSCENSIEPADYKHFVPPILPYGTPLIMPTGRWEGGVLMGVDLDFAWKARERTNP